MYPVIRFAKDVARHKTRAPLTAGQTHTSHHICWPWDIDPWLELNNGRTLTLYDLNRIPLFFRLGIIPVVRKNNWNMAVAGASIRYRRRVRAFHRFEMRGVLLGWDDRFFYAQQSMWHHGEATSSILLRMAATNDKGILDPAKVVQAIGWKTSSPALPEYAQAWCAAEAMRPWPPSV